MKVILRNIVFPLFATIVFFLAHQPFSKAQFVDTIVYDFGTSGGCLICGSGYECFTSKTVSVNDNKTGLKLNSIKIKFFFTGCASAPEYAILNGDTLGSFTSSYTCQCSSCTVDSIVANQNKLGSYNINGSNSLLMSNANLCCDKVLIIRTYQTLAPDNAGIFSVDSPFYQCPGTKNIVVTIANNGNNALDSVRVNWTFNGVSQSTYYHTTKIDTIGSSGGNKAKIVLGSKTFTAGKTDTLVVWTSNPNGKNDTINADDTLRVYLSPAVSGTFTVGGSSPDYSSVQNAINALSSRGLCGPVVLNVRNGSYYEQITIPQLPGSSTTNTLTIQSETGDSSLVNLYYSSSTSSANYTLAFGNLASNIIIRKLTVEATGSSYSTAILFQGINTNINVTNCRILGVSSSSTSTNRIVISKPNTGGMVSNLNITNNEIKYGSYGINIQNSSTAFNNNIQNNNITGFYYYGLLFNGIYNLNCSNNNIETSTSSASYAYGLQIGNCDSFKVSNNRIYLRNGGTGIYTFNNTGSSNKRSRIFNNFISCYSNAYGDAYAWQDNYSTFIDFFYNSTYTKTLSNGYSNIYVAYADNIRLFNNSVYHDAPGNLIYTNYSSSQCFSLSNNNCFYQSGTPKFQNKAVFYNSLAGWTSGTGLDSASRYGNPFYTASDNLHAKGSDLNAGAVPVSGITTDIDGATRNSTTPDIGADEFDLPPVDAGISSIESFKADSICVKVSIKNYGNDTLKTATINWSINGVVKSAYSWTGSLASSKSSQVCIGYFKFLRDTLYHVKAWTTSPNGSADTINYNDTFLISAKPALSGVYTIGGTSPDFATFSDAVAALNSAGIIDSVRFRVRAGTYNEQLAFGTINGVFGGNKVIFESENGDSTSVVLTYSGSYSYPYVISLNGATGITFRRMTIQNTNSSSPGRVIYFSGNNNQISINSNIIRNFNTSSTDTYYDPLIYCDNYNQDITISGNMLLGGSTALYNSSDKTLIFQNNQLDSQYYMGVRFNTIYSADISGNQIKSVSGYNNFYAVYIGNWNGNGRFNNNTITGPDKSERYGVYISQYPSLSTDTVYFYNNFVSTGGNNQCYTVYIDYSENLKISNNSIHNYSSDTANSIALYFDYVDYTEVTNNIISNRNGGIPYYVYYLYSGFVSNYNNYFSPNALTTYFDGSNYYSLADLQSTGNDSNSLNVNPVFSTNTDLHCNSLTLNNKGLPRWFVTTDIDGETRSSTPDIGADEYEPPTRDIGITELLSPGVNLKPTATSIKAVVYNFGIDTVTVFKSIAIVNKDTIGPVTVNRTLNPGDTVHVTIGTYTFKRDSINNIKVWTYLPNNLNDQKASNDTISVKNKKTAMSGVYTIGGSSPDFATFNLAVAALNSSGISDSVRFRVRSGTYNEHIELTPVSGAGMVNSIIFESENLDSSSVTLSYNAALFDSNYVVYYNGADGITFRNLTLKATGSSYARVVVMENGAQNNKLNNNSIEGTTSSTTSNYAALIHSGNSGSSENNNSIIDNLLLNGSYAIYWYGYGSYPNYYETGNSFSGNMLKDQYYRGLYILTNNNAVIKNNKIQSNSGHSSFTGIYADDCPYALRITGNEIIRTSGGGVGIYSYGSSSDSTIIANNMISFSNTQSCYGMQLYYGYKYFIAHNSIYINSSNSNSYPLYMYYGSNNQLLNNILVSQASRVIYCPSSGSFSEIKNNNYFGSGTDFAYYNGSVYSNYTSYLSGNTLDSNSLSKNPIFYSSTNLHVKSPDINGAAKKLNWLTTDIDGEMRDTIKPDIGADEFMLPPLDAGIADIIVPKIPFAADTQIVKVVLKNFGNNTISTAIVEWKLNGISKTAYSFSGSLNTGDTVHIVLGKEFFHRDSAYSMICYSRLPNSVNDTINSNDTATVTNQYPALRGIYTIGGASPDFNSFTDAVNALKRGGIIDSVVFKVRNGTYNEQIAIPAIVGASKANSIVFESESGDSSLVLLTTNLHNFSNNHTLKLDGTKGVTFRKMSIAGGNTSYGNLVNMINGVENCAINNCALSGYQNTTSSNFYLININTNSVKNNLNISINNNTFNSGSYGIYYYGYYGGVYDKNLVVSGNSINCYYIGIYSLYVDSAVFEKNIITNTLYSNAYGMYLYYNRFVRINNNNVQLTSGAYPIYIYECDGSSTRPSLVYNNMFFGGSNTSIGAQIYYCDYTNVYYNNINILSTSSSSYAIYFANGSNLKSVNNVFKASAGYALYTNTTSNITQSNFNNYYTGGSTLAYWGGNRATLSDLKAANSKDANSINADPQYVSSSDLHTRAIAINEKGTPISGITTDYDGQTRSATAPDIGADEFEIPGPNDAGISAFNAPVLPFTSGSQSIKVVIYNYGSDTLKSATLNWQMNGVTQSSSSWTGSLPSGSSQIVTLGNFSFTGGVQYTLRSWTTLPNGVPDTINYNDTLVKTELYSALAGVYTIGGTLPSFNTIADALNALKLGGVSDTVTFNLRNGTYNEQNQINAYAGSSSTRPVIFQAENGDSSKVILTYNNSYSNNYIFNLLGADNIKFRKLTFIPANYYYRHCIQIAGGTDNTEISNCEFKGSSSGNSEIIYSSGDKDDNLIIKGNTFNINCSYTILLYGQSGSVSNYESGLQIVNNIFNGSTSYDIYLAYQKNFNISGNAFNASTNYSNIYLNQNAENFDIAKNKFMLSTNASAINSYYHAGTNSLRGRIYNNFISSNGSSGSIINWQNNGYTDIDFNSINAYNASGNCNIFYISSNTNLRLRNNSAFNQGSGYVYYIASNIPDESDYNNLITNGANLVYQTGTNRANLSSWKSATGRDANSLSINPLFSSNTDLHTNLITLDSAGTPISGITTDIDGDTRNTTKPDIGADEFNSLPNNLGITAFNMVSGCSLDSQVVKMTFFNFGNKSQSNFYIKYAVNGNLKDSLLVTDSIQPGQSLMKSFSNKFHFGSYAAYVFKGWTDLGTEQYRINDSASATINNYQSVAAVGSMIPADSAKNIDFPFSVSWTPATGATLYDVYIWPDSVSTRPSSPTFANLSQISRQIAGGLGYGVKYKWQVVSKNPGCSVDGAVQIFTIKELPDLTVTTVSAPVSAFSGNSITVSWVVKNNGSGSTGSGSWYDYVYMSADKIWDGSDQYMGGAINPASLNPGQSYTSSTSLNIPNGISGKYYFIIRSDAGNGLLESDEGNNIRSDSAGTNITLTPPPDLQVTSVTKPSVVFSGNNIPVSFTVKNKGTGNTRTSAWYDLIYLSTDSVFNGSAVHKANIYHSGALEPDSQYTVVTSIFIPLSASGKYFVYVVTDGYNQVYEHTQESNNTGRSDSMIVKLTPPPDLIIKNITIADSASNGETLALRYAVYNQGGTATSNGWFDGVYISTAPSFSFASSTHLNSAYTSLLNPGDSSVKTLNIKIPDSYLGNYYLYAVANRDNAVFEGSGDTNNVVYRTLWVVNPDLRVASVSGPSQDSSGKFVQLDWKVVNDGPGKDVYKKRKDLIYLGSSATFKTDSVVRIDSVSYFTEIGKNDTVSKSMMVRIPNGTSGLRYFYVYTDADSDVKETNNTNNITRSAGIQVILSPSADLVPLVLSVPDTAEAGAAFKTVFEVKNNGNATAVAQWKDRVYLSKDSVFNLSKCILLGTRTHLNSQAVNSTYSDSVEGNIPGSISAGNYYFYVFTEADNVIYEHNAETNNTLRSKKIYVKGYPPVDLKVESVTIQDSANSGTSITFSWKVINIGQASTLADFWTDRAYLSVDSVFDASDVLIGELQHTEDLLKDSSYTASRTFAIPNGTSGNRYVIVWSDYNNDNNDDDTTNNKGLARNGSGAAKPIYIKLTASADLKITSWQIPGSGVAGQQVKIVWTVKNDGIGATLSGSWIDKVYLSTDYVLDNTDIAIGSKTHYGNLAVSGQYTDSGNYYIPSNYTGNYIVIIQTDETNREYEHNAENNNTATSVMTISVAPPADLIVSSVTAPSSVKSGEIITINYTVKNIGSNPSTGGYYDNVYLSKDSFWDATDVLFRSDFNYSTILPGNSQNRTSTGTVSGVAVGDYYAIVYTDIRNNINESNDTNNTAYSNVLNVNIPLLAFKTLQPDTLVTNKVLYYRLVVPDSLNGESILIQLKGDSINGNNEMFVRFGDVPSKSTFDYAYKDPFKGNQEIIIPSALSGTYYIMAVGQTPASTKQPITLYARKLDFEIRKVSPVKGGNTGEVTLKIEGSKFTPQTTFQLVNDSITISSEEPDTLGRMYSRSTQPAKSVIIQDPTVAYITMDLSGQPLGVYDVYGRNGAISEARLPKGFTIENGIPPDIQIDVIRPSNTRTNAIISFVVNYSNAGNVNLKNGKLEIVSNGGAAISLSPGGLSANLTSISVIMEEDGGPSGVLRPAGTGKVTIYTNSSTALGFNILLPVIK